MSVTAETTRLTIPKLTACKGQQKIVALTAYSAVMARLLDPHVDLLLVGDSVGMVVYGFPSTLPVTLRMMIDHGKAVVGASMRAVVIVDMPFGSYQSSPAEAFANAARIMAETGASGVKLEGGAPMAATIEFLVQRGIPVLAHIGVMPQAINQLGGYRRRGKSETEAQQIMQDAAAVQQSGAFGVVLEGVTAEVAAEVTRTLGIPTIGIGASNDCDGQILVSEDIVGLSGNTPPAFVKQHANLSLQIEDAVKAYAAGVRNGQ